MWREVVASAGCRFGGCVFLACIPVCAALADKAGSIPGMAPSSGPIGLPSIGRVVIAFLLVIGLAIGVLLALRRYQPQWTKHLAGSNSIRVLERSSVGAVRVYLLQVEGRKILLTEHRNAMALLPLERDDVRDNVSDSEVSS